jgi:hypothetical protein
VPATTTPPPGRFIARDPLHGVIYATQSLNRYAYAYDNPAIFTDLNGLLPRVDFEYYEIDKTEDWWNDVSREGLADPNPAIGFVKWAGGKTANLALDMGPEAFQDLGRSLGDPYDSNWNLATAAAETGVDILAITGAGRVGNWLGSKIASRLAGVSSKCGRIGRAAWSGLQKAAGKGRFWGRAADESFTIHPRVINQLQDLGSLSGRIGLDELQALINNPQSMRLLNTKSGNISIIQRIDGKMMRITVARNEMKIISVGRIKQNQIINRIANGDWILLK